MYTGLQNETEKITKRKYRYYTKLCVLYSEEERGHNEHGIIIY